jgi:hypothetical protein
VFALLREARITDRRDRLNLFRWILDDPSVMSTNDLNEHEIQGIADTLRNWQREGELEAQARAHTGPFS